MRARVAFVLTLSAALAAPVAAPAKQAHRKPPRVVLTGAPVQQVTECGATRKATVAGTGARVVARIPGRRRAIYVERCSEGRWLDRARRIEGALPTASDGDFRVRPVAKGGRAAYLRVGKGEIVDVPITFHVKNENGSIVPCATDGKPYDIHGSLVGPRSVLDAAQPAVTLILHGLSYGEWAWRFQAVPGYDFAAELAKAGHVIVAIDRLGYNSSAGPDGNDICIGSQADIAHQIVGQLRSGDYQFGAGTPTSFKRVVLMGHSIGGLTSELEAYSFGEIDGLIVASYSDSGGSPLELQTFAADGGKCLGGGEERAGPGTQPHYSPFGETDADFRAIHVAPDMDPAVSAAATKLRTRDPCGDIMSTAQALVGNELLLNGIQVPVLLILGSKDALFPPPAGALQGGRYLGSDNAKYVEIAGAPHAIMLSHQAPQFRAAVAAWLADHGA